MPMKDRIRSTIMKTPLRALVVDTRYLRQVGWSSSFGRGGSFDAAGEPIPWLAYPAIDFLARRTPRDVRVFEWGSGNSTLWWAARSSEVVACEHDPAWAARVRRTAPPNVTLLELPVGDPYIDAPRRMSPFDVIVIDGRERVRCAASARDALTARGVIIWDNTDRETYSEGIQALVKMGFRSVTFAGLAPLVTSATETTVFYRDDNVLGL